MSPIRTLTFFIVIIVAGSVAAQIDGYTCTNEYLDCGDVVESNVITVEIQDITGLPGDTVWLPVSLNAPSDTIDAFMMLITWDDTYLRPVTLAGDSIYLEFELAGAFASVADDFFVQLSQNSADEGAIAAFFNLGGMGPWPALPPGDHGIIFRIPFVVDPMSPSGIIGVFGFSAVNEYVVIDEPLLEAFCADCRRTNMAVKYDCEYEIYDTLSTNPLIIDTSLGITSCSRVEYPTTVDGYLGLPVGWVNPPISYSGDHCDLVALDYEAMSSAASVLIFTNEGSFGSVTATGANTCRFTYAPTLADVGASLVAVIGVSDGVNPMATTETNLNFTNLAPVFTSGIGTTTVMRTGSIGCTTVSGDDVDCDPSTVTIVDITPAIIFGSSSVIDNGDNSWSVCIETDLPDLFTVTIEITDGGPDKATSTGVVYFDADDIQWFEVQIEKTHDAYQGQHEMVDVTLESSDYDVGGFDFLVAYDASALGLQSAVPGPAFYDPAPDGCGWEYFNFRYGPFGNCGDACPSGMVRVFGMAETNNGPNHPSCFLPDSLPATLFTLDFLVSNDRTLECMYAPVRFFWSDCGDNSVSSMDGEVLYVSDHIYEFEGTEIADPTYGFPTYFGVQTECLNPDPNKPSVIQFIDFYNGGVDIVCADSIDARGDINLNGVSNEVADAVLFSNYFVHGIGVFNVPGGMQGQIAATDVNSDGLTLSVADLVYLIRIITGDAPPYPKVGATMAAYSHENGVMSIDLKMGAAFIVLEGEVYPRLLAENMDMSYAFDGMNTRVLVSKIERGAGFQGDFLGCDGEVVSVEFATYDGASVAKQEVPKDYSLNQNYPNPFNPKTTISFGLPFGGDYSLSIYNIAGRKVASFEGTHEPGTVSIDWDGSDEASGVYFYRLDTENFTETKKMMLLK